MEILTSPDGQGEVLALLDVVYARKETSDLEFFPRAHTQLSGVRCWVALAPHMAATLPPPPSSTSTSNAFPSLLALMSAAIYEKALSYKTEEKVKKNTLRQKHQTGKRWSFLSHFSVSLPHVWLFASHVCNDVTVRLHRVRNIAPLGDGMASRGRWRRRHTRPPPLLARNIQR